MGFLGLPARDGSESLPPLPPFPPFFFFPPPHSSLFPPGRNGLWWLFARGVGEDGGCVRPGALAGDRLAFPGLARPCHDSVVFFHEAPQASACMCLSAGWMWLGERGKGKRRAGARPLTLFPGSCPSPPGSATGRVRPDRRRCRRLPFSPVFFVGAFWRPGVLGARERLAFLLSAACPNAAARRLSKG